MLISVSKTKAAAFLFCILLTTSVTLMAIPVQAQTNLPSGVTPTNLQSGASELLPTGVTPDSTVSTRAFLSFTPNPIGVGQSLLVNLWIVPPLHVSRYFTGYTVTITKPDGAQDVETLESFRGDATAYFEYVVDQVGEYKLQFTFPGGYFPAGNYTTAEGAVLAMRGAVTTSFTESCYYEPSSTQNQTLVVQQDQVMSWPSVPLPTDYWTRPISPDNREWWPIAGAYPYIGYEGGGSTWDQLYPNTNPAWSSNYGFTPWVQAPNTAHIVWRQQEALDGLVGGSPAGQNSNLGSVATPSVIYNGRCYQTMTVPINGVPTSCAVCYDLRTGQQYYAIPTSEGGVTPTIVSYTSTYATLSGLPAVPGGTAGAGVAAELLTITGGYLIKIDPMTGAVNLNASIDPLTGSGGTYYKNQYVLAIQDLGSAAGADRYRLLNWTTAGTNTDLASRIISNTTYALSRLPSLIDYNAGIGVSVSGSVNTATGVANQTTITAYSLATGQQMWNKTVGMNTYSGSTEVADHGMVALLFEDGLFHAFDLTSGKEMWQSESMDYPWSSSSFGAYTIQSAYGMLFREAYDGVYAFNWTNGKIVWKYEETAPPFETPYTNENGSAVYSFSWNAGGNSGMEIADGKLYTFNDEHTPSLPITRGWAIHCINITTGQGIWNLTGYWAPGGMADGYLTAGNMYDGYMYVFGKGKSATTVSAPQTTIPVGTGIVISGSVLDQSPAQPGTPCVSEDSMATYMEYLYAQAPIDGLYHNVTVTGVPVSIDAVDSSGAYFHIATVTSDIGGTYAYTWIPTTAGDYKITATFMGDVSYGSSFATTYVSVSETPATATPEPEPSVDYMPMMYAILAAVVVAIIIGIIAILVALRKR